ncbi:MAG: hypothetical protein EA398_11120 [Deltaproteobacteria bacterium]|nr:MAG: hypothetical protein EA398_11120 [Deltaproteobacteria bacterium]
MTQRGQLSSPLGLVKARAYGVAEQAAPGLHARLLKFSAFGPYTGAYVDDIIAAVRRLNAQGRGTPEVLPELAERAWELAQAGEFDRWLDHPSGVEPGYVRVGLSTCRDFSPHRRWRLQVYHVAPGTAAPPHAHFDLGSFMLVLRGSLHVREYERVGGDGESHVVLRCVHDGMLGVGEHSCSTQQGRNVHWFCANDEPAVALNLNLRGWEDIRDEDLFGRSGRRYVDPTAVPDADGRIHAPIIGVEQAEERFGTTRLDAFAAPPVGPTVSAD